MNTTLEICCGSYQDALSAERGGATRIELNNALHLGGLTPSLATLQLTKHNTRLQIIAMIRPRAAGFCYRDTDLQVMLQDAEILLQHGADGIAFGCLDERGSIQKEQTKPMLELIKRYNAQAVFHRAFDCVPEPHSAIKQLINLGVDRILTSGLQPKAAEGVELIAQLQRQYGADIELLPGSGVTPQNAKWLLQKTGVRQLHSSCKGWVSDPTTLSGHVSYAYAEAPYQSDYEVVSETKVRTLLASL
jgi:copper homeostasis protein